MPIELKKIKKVQLALFAKEIELKKGKGIDIAKELQNKAGTFLNGEPAVIPLPEDVPEEIPGIILHSTDGKFQCTVGKKRVDFSETHEDIEADIDTVFPSFKEKAGAIIDFAESLKIEIVRVGFVVDFITQLDVPSKDLILEKILGSSTYSQSRKDKINVVTITVAEKDTIKGMAVNRHIFVDSGVRKKDDGTNDKYLQLRYDVNTLPESEQLLAKQFILELLDGVYDEIKQNGAARFFGD